MKPNILKRWVRALRSGRYKQGKTKLKIENGVTRYCCLGVLCDLHSKETGKNWNGEQYMGRSGVLPDRVRMWAGLKSKDPILTGEGKYATELNDNGNRFTTIAKLIEQAQKEELI